MKNPPTTRTTGRYKLQYRGVECLNCGHPLDLSDKYCPNCSQANSTKKLSLLDFFEEYFTNILSYDSKILQTLTALLLRPGKITRDYIAGKRLSYTNPFRFLLSLAIIYFLLISISGEFENLNKFGSENKESIFNFQKQINTIEFDSEEEKKQALAAIDSLKKQQYIGNKINNRDSIILSNPVLHFKNINNDGVTERFFNKIQFFNAAIKNDTIFSFTESVAKYDLANSTENEMAYNLSNSLVEIEKRPGTFVNTLISKSPFATFFFLPFFSLFIWLAYIRKKHTYTDHLIFSFHNQSLLFILLIVSYLVNAIFNFSSEGIFILIFALYLYKAMRNFYQQGRFKTIVKYVFLNSVFIILGIIAITILIAASVFTY
ncbi:DUF3667 domain-containing protein [Maribacter sp. MAR_2009_72]|uniref:DUF3667 domain-containing protein n=1 Tax=Maribacter sp. MAR_2009_72 TaxID=1250050 RepID=UPI001198FF00|nr:DUF3667 domain-containing protein [Maribacter sp. MAR_2009_72]TVZ15235.1 uncharacterized protein DUF3667 [Maribacter sp. MAR_2009_72]